jgi:hypothetical protein
MEPHITLLAEVKLIYIYIYISRNLMMMMMMMMMMENPARAVGVPIYILAAVHPNASDNAL